MSIVFGKVPHPGYLDIQNEMAGKREGVGWNNLGQRVPKHVALHRMYGTLAGTRTHFGNPNVASLTDYGLGVEPTDGKAAAGIIHLYNNPRGFRSGWASGPVSAPYGDGAKFVQKFGINAVNRDCVSVEVSGYDTTTVDAFAWKELVHLVAYWADQCKVPYSSLPLNPNTGINFIIWHEEFTYGTGKKCPFTYMKNNTNRLYADVKAFLQPYQEGVVSGPVKEEPKPTPVPEPTWMPPAPVTQLALVDPNDTDAVEHLRIVNGVEFVFVNDRVRATQTTKRLRYAYADSKVIGPDIKKGEEFDVLWLFKAGDGHYYYYTPWHSRVRADHTERISD